MCVCVCVCTCLYVLACVRVVAQSCAALDLQGIPFLEEDEDLDFASNTARLKVTSVMSNHPVVFSEMESIDSILDVLANCTHQGFPVVSYTEEPTALNQSVSVYRHHGAQDPRVMLYRGFILRSQLALIIQYYLETGSVTPDYQWFVKWYPRHPRTAKLTDKLIKHPPEVPAHVLALDRTVQ